MPVEFRAIRENERDECLDLWRTVWPGDTRAYFERYLFYDVEWLPYYTQVACLDGRLVSAVTICKRIVACGEYRLTMGGVGNVATLPEFRGRGYNTECLKRAVTVMEADAMDFSLLFTGIHEFYARVGYVTMPSRRLGGGVRPNLAAVAGITVTQATDADMPAIRAMYDEYNRDRPIAVLRSEAYWRDWLGPTLRRKPYELYLARNDMGSAVGYIRYRVEHTQTSVVEFATNGGAQEHETTEALLGSAARAALEAGLPQVELRVAFTPAVLAAAEKALTEPNWIETTSGMVRLLHRDNLVRCLTPELNERWRAAESPRGMVAFETPYGPMTIDAGGSFLKIHTPASAAGALPQSALFTLMFHGALALPTDDPFLSALFPPREAVYWGADGF